MIEYLVEENRVLREQIGNCRMRFTASLANGLRMNRFVRTIKEGCLEQMIFFGEDSLRNAIREFVAHHFDRNHQGLDNRLIIPSQLTTAKVGAVRTRRRLGGMLNYYYRDAA